MMISFASCRACDRGHERDAVRRRHDMRTKVRRTSDAKARGPDARDLTARVHRQVAHRRSGVGMPGTAGRHRGLHHAATATTGRRGVSGVWLDAQIPAGGLNSGLITVCGYCDVTDLFPAASETRSLRSFTDRLSRIESRLRPADSPMNTDVPRTRRSGCPSTSTRARSGS